MDIDTCYKLAHAIATLLSPLAEVVIHDLKSQKIIFIEGDLSKRMIGDPSFLDNDLHGVGEDLAETVYTKLNYDGRLLKSISIPLEENGTVIALFCINYDITVFKELHALTGAIFSATVSKQPAVLFKSDWQERINEFMHNLLKTEGLQFATLTNKDKKRIVCKLYERGAFAEKNAADYIAKLLTLSRATVFNYLRACKGNNNAT